MLAKNITIGLLLLTSSISAVASNKQIDFHIEGVKDASGKVYIQLFKGRDNYENGKAEVATAVSPKNNEVKVSFQNLEEGEYALRYFHDENDNGQMETNLFGMPTEGYGFSNSAKPNFGPVSFDDIKFQLDDSQSQVLNTSQVIY